VLNKMDSYGLMHLHRAMKPHNGDEVRELVLSGVDVNGRALYGYTVDGYTVLQWAAVQYGQSRDQSGWKETLLPLWEKRPRYRLVTLESLQSLTVAGMPSIVDRDLNRMLHQLGFIELDDKVLQEL